MTSLTANGITLSYDSFGDEDAAVILLISGLGAQMIRWTDSFCQHLVAEGFRVIRFDNRDAGLSTHFTTSPSADFVALANAIAAGRKLNVPYTLYDMVADAVGLLDALSINQVHVVGRSMGGMIAQLLASGYPQRVLSLCSIMSGTGNLSLASAAPDIMAMLMKPAPDPFEEKERFVAHGLAFAKRISGSGYAVDEQAHRAIILAEARRAYDPGGFGRQIAAIAATGDIRPQLSHIRAPTLVVHGTEDALIPAACGEDTVASVRNADLLLITGMGHDLPAALYEPICDAIFQNMRRQT
ncbi:alpha/beta fold hydrolase [Erwiniaceae bacterium BAC15a-03b]|uniref:Alpha/beta fold hydrolase n=1 Tax=Winslowiella arboricola TaxID=2978220 RepID=A0A9J6PY00_9GAMM|nr:alpha/beta hydrolase [Winslowiella arboricola]MCU5775267.1 alpha/beta fold hydrolase [Winslowiella arboricola]MCU5780336.1 alpha/beta fold hydrolase [Winslowiella arboricola]